MATIRKLGRGRYKAIHREPGTGAFIESKTFSTLALAKEWGARKDRAREEAAASGSRAHETTVGELLDAYAKAEPRRAEVRAGQLGWWRAHLGADTLLVNVTRDTIRQALQAYATSKATRFVGKGLPPRVLSRSPSGSAVNRHLSAIGGVFTYGMDAGYLSESPARVKRRPENPARERALSEAELKRLLDAAKASSWTRLYALLLLYATCGARKSEGLRIRWCDIDWEARVATVPPDDGGRHSKTGIARRLNLTPQVVAELGRFRAVGEGLVFGREKDPHQPFTFRKHFEKALDEAGIPRSGKDKVTIHTLRHSFCTWLAEKGAEAHDIRQAAGHRSLATTMKYIHPSDARVRQVIDTAIGGMLDRVLSGATDAQ